jgi:hypothetical protein
MNENGEVTIRCSVCFGRLGDFPQRDIESTIGAAGWLRTPIVTVCEACALYLRAALGIVQNRYERIGMEALKQAALTQAALTKTLTEPWPVMSQPANPDPTGVFSKTEFDLAAAKGLNAPQPEPIPTEPRCSVDGCELPGHFQICEIWICKHHHEMIEVRFREGVL